MQRFEECQPSFTSLRWRIRLGLRMESYDADFMP
jgi:hypothetical protein